MRELMSIIRALDNENRLRILVSLRDGEVCLCQLIEVLALAPSTVSKHVDLLRQAGLVEMRKDGRWHHYRLAGRGASPAVRDTIRWVLRSVKDDGLIGSDAARLARVREAAPEKWTACYTKS